MVANALKPAPEAGRYLVILTEVRPLKDGVWRDERHRPERRCQVATAETPQAAAALAGALSSLGMVRTGRQRVKVLTVGGHAARRFPDGQHAPDAETRVRRVASLALAH